MIMRPRNNLIPEAYEQKPFLSRLVSGMRNELKAAWLARCPEPTKKFVIFAQGRTGSTLLTSTLDMHPLIRCDDEILSLPRAFPTKFVENSARRNIATCYGFHVKITQLAAWQRIRDIRAFLDKLEDCGWSIIYLWRQNVLRQTISNIFAERMGSYHLGAGHQTNKPDRIYIPIPRLAYDLPFRMRLREAEWSSLAGRKFLEVIYERDLQSLQTQSATFCRIQSDLGVPHVDLAPALRKMVDRPLSDLVENYDEVANWISTQSQFDNCLDE